MFKSQFELFCICASEPKWPVTGEKCNVLRKEGDALFNDALRAYYFLVYGVGRIVRGPLR